MATRQGLITWAGILGILGMALPAMIHIYGFPMRSGSIFIIGMQVSWSPSFGVYFQFDNFSMLLHVGGAMTIAGIILLFLTFLRSWKQPVMRWLPGVLMLVGPAMFVALYFIMLFMVIPIGYPLGIIAGVMALVVGSQDELRV